MTKRTFVTLSDVAMAAGVSRSQASRALRGDPGVRDDLRRHIREKARELGYFVNVAARQLASGEVTGVGLVIGEPMNPYHMMMASEMAEALKRAGLDPIIHLGRAGVEVTVEDMEFLARYRVFAAVLIGSPVELSAVPVLDNILPCIYIGEDVSARGVRCIVAEDAAGARQATEHLISLGHRRIAHISGGTGAGARCRAQGYQDAMKDAGLDPVIYPGWFDLDGGQAGADALMARRERPTAFFCASDRIAMGAMNRLLHLGFRVPEDVSVVGFDDAIDSGSETISLTTVRQSAALFGRFVTEHALAIRAGKQKGLTAIVPTELIVRGTSAPLRK